MKQIFIGLSLLVVLGLFGPVGCGDMGKDNVAIVGDYKIGSDEFSDYAANYMRALPVPFSTAEEEFAKRREALDSLITTRLLIQAAYEKKLDEVEEIARVILANKNKFLLDVLYTSEITSKIQVSDAEIKDYYNRLEYKIRAYQVVVESEDTAQMLFQRLVEGANIEQLAYEYSTDPSAKRNRGNLGYFVWGAMVDEFQEAVFDMEPGELSPPVKSPYGYHVIKVVDKTPNEMRGTYEEMEETIKGQISRRKSDTVLREYMEAIHQKYPVTLDRATCEYLLNKREQLYPPQILASLPRSDFDPEQLDRNERELIVASWEGGQMSVIDYLSQMRQWRLPVQLWPDFDDYDSLRVMCVQLLQPEILAYEATLAGLENTDEFKDKLLRYKELVMADMMRNDSIPLPPMPDETAARQYYDDNLDEFSKPATVQVYEIQLSDELQAQKLAREIKSLEAFKAKAREVTERPGKRSSGGSLGNIQRDWFPEIFDKAWTTPIGSIGGPIMAGGKYSVIYVVDRVQAELKDFLYVKRAIVEKLRADQAGLAFTQWVEERKSITNIEINEEMIWSIIDRTKYESVDSSQSPAG